MTHIDYDLLRMQRPDLKLPHWYQIHPGTRAMILRESTTPMMLIKHFVTARLCGEIPDGFYK